MTLRVNGQSLRYLDEGEISELHERLAFVARMTGLQDHALDVAISRAFTAIVQVIEQDRDMAEKRRATIREVKCIHELRRA
jgi:hypothetical protein